MGVCISTINRKRTRNIKHGIFIGLSSGYDSGAIACELEKQGIPFTAYSIVGSEDEQTIKQRVVPTSDPRLIFMEREQFISSRNHLKECCEEYSLRIDNGEIDWINDYEREIQEIEEKIASHELLNEKLGWNTEVLVHDVDEVKRLKNRADTQIKTAPENN